jgi:hypothetical protein
MNSAWTDFGLGPHADGQAQWAKWPGLAHASGVARAHDTVTAPWTHAAGRPSLALQLTRSDEVTGMSNHGDLGSPLGNSSRAGTHSSGGSTWRWRCNLSTGRGCGGW